MASGSPKLPPELFIQIIAQVPYNVKIRREHQFLSNCSTISRTFRSICQARLFGTVILPSFEGAIKSRKLLTLLKESPHIAPLIHTLHVQSGWQRATEGSRPQVMWVLAEPTFPQVLDLLPALKTLYLASGTVQHLAWNEMGSKLQQSFLRVFALPSLTTITFRNIKLPSTVFLSSPQLLDLSVALSTLQPPSTSDSEESTPQLDRANISTAPPTLKSLTLILKPIVPDYTILSSALDLSCLTSLDFKSDGKDLSILSSIFTTCRNTLMKFCWTIANYELSSNKAMMAALSHSTFPPNIQFLKLSMDDNTLPILDTPDKLAPFTWVLRALQNPTYNKSQLHTLTFDMSFYDLNQFATLPIWLIMDSVLAPQGRSESESFNNLRCVNLRLHRSSYLPYKEEVPCSPEELIGRRLPGLSSRGDVLRVEYIDDREEY